jgi:hypothetical protein
VRTFSLPDVDRCCDEAEEAIFFMLMFNVYTGDEEAWLVL